MRSDSFSAVPRPRAARGRVLSEPQLAIANLGTPARSAWAWHVKTTFKQDTAEQ